MKFKKQLLVTCLSAVGLASWGQLAAADVVTAEWKPLEAVSENSNDMRNVKARFVIQRPIMGIWEPSEYAGPTELKPLEAVSETYSNNMGNVQESFVIGTKQRPMGTWELSEYAGPTFNPATKMGNLYTTYVSFKTDESRTSSHTRLSRPLSDLFEQRKATLDVLKDEVRRRNHFVQDRLNEIYKTLSGLDADFLKNGSPLNLIQQSMEAQFKKKVGYDFHNLAVDYYYGVAYELGQMLNKFKTKYQDGKILSNFDKIKLVNSELEGWANDKYLKIAALTGRLNDANKDIVELDEKGIFGDDRSGKSSRLNTSLLLRGGNNRYDSFYHKQNINGNKNWDSVISEVGSAGAFNNYVKDHMILKDYQNILNLAKSTDLLFVHNKQNEYQIAVNAANIATNQAKIAKNATRIDNLNKRTNALKTRLESGSAVGAGLAGLFQPYSVDKVNLSLSLGGHKKQTAIAVGVGMRFNDKLAAKTGIALNLSQNSGVAYNAGINFEPY